MWWFDYKKEIEKLEEECWLNEVKENEILDTFVINDILSVEDIWKELYIDFLKTNKNNVLELELAYTLKNKLNLDFDSHLYIPLYLTEDFKIENLIELIKFLEIKKISDLNYYLNGKWFFLNCSYILIRMELNEVKNYFNNISKENFLFNINSVFRIEDYFMKKEELVNFFIDYFWDILSENNYSIDDYSLKRVIGKLVLNQHSISGIKNALRIVWEPKSRELLKIMSSENWDNFMELCMLEDWEKVCEIYKINSFEEFKRFKRSHFSDIKSDIILTLENSWIIKFDKFIDLYWCFSDDEIWFLRSIFHRSEEIFIYIFKNIVTSKKDLSILIEMCREAPVVLFFRTEIKDLENVKDIEWLKKILDIIIKKEIIKGREENRQAFTDRYIHEELEKDIWSRTIGNFYFLLKYFWIDIESQWKNFIYSIWKDKIISMFSNKIIGKFWDSYFELGKENFKFMKSLLNILYNSSDSISLQKFLSTNDFEKYYNLIKFREDSRYVRNLYKIIELCKNREDFEKLNININSITSISDYLYTNNLLYIIHLSKNIDELINLLIKDKKNSEKTNFHYFMNIGSFRPKREFKVLAYFFEDINEFENYINSNENYYWLKNLGNLEYGVFLSLSKLYNIDSKEKFISFTNRNDLEDICELAAFNYNISYLIKKFWFWIELTDEERINILKVWRLDINIINLLFEKLEINDKNDFNKVFSISWLIEKIDDLVMFFKPSIFLNILKLNTNINNRQEFISFILNSKEENFIINGSEYTFKSILDFYDLDSIEDYEKEVSKNIDILESLFALNKSDREFIFWILNINDIKDLKKIIKDENNLMKKVAKLFSEISIWEFQVYKTLIKTKDDLILLENIKNEDLNSKVFLKYYHTDTSCNLYESDYDESLIIINRLINIADDFKDYLDFIIWLKQYFHKNSHIKHIISLNEVNKLISEWDKLVDIQKYIIEKNGKVTELSEWYELYLF